MPTEGSDHLLKLVIALARYFFGLKLKEDAPRG
jgi:hypothetical protein